MRVKTTKISLRWDDPNRRTTVQRGIMQMLQERRRHILCYNDPEADGIKDLLIPKVKPYFKIDPHLLRVNPDAQVRGESHFDQDVRNAVKDMGGPPDALTSGDFYAIRGGGVCLPGHEPEDRSRVRTDFVRFKNLRFGSTRSDDDDADDADKAATAISNDAAADIEMIEKAIAYAKTIFSSEMARATLVQTIVLSDLSSVLIDRVDRLIATLEDRT